jgi:hypothetical protein
LKDWSWFFIFGVVLGHATEQQWETAWESLLHMLGILQLSSEMGSTQWWWLLSAKFMPPDMHDLWNMSHVIESPMSTISNSCLHPSSVTYNMGVMTGCESRKELSLISNFVNWLPSTSIPVFLHIPLFLLFITTKSHF